ncbi:MAG TPA: hypothetical protein PKW51_01995, partial [Methanoregulaceae archaeon]|nr:hypothetical protein [Methanoregulaceae archaeon]
QENQGYIRRTRTTPGKSKIYQENQNNTRKIKGISGEPECTRRIKDISGEPEQHQENQRDIRRTRTTPGESKIYQENQNNTRKIRDISGEPECTRRNSGCPAFFLINLHLSGT